MDRIIEASEKEAASTGAKKPNASTADASDNSQICSAVPDEAVDATDTGGHGRRSVIEIVEKGRRRIAAGEATAAVIRWAVALYPEKAVAIASLLVPHHSYGPGKHFKNAEQYAVHLIREQINKRQKRRSKLPRHELRRLADAGDDAAKKTLERLREAERRSRIKAIASGKRAETLRKYKAKVASKKATQSLSQSPESHDGAQR